MTTYWGEYDSHTLTAYDLVHLAYGGWFEAL
jgi:hypothetical protein